METKDMYYTLHACIWMDYLIQSLIKTKNKKIFVIFPPTYILQLLLSHASNFTLISNRNKTINLWKQNIEFAFFTENGV